MIAVTDARYVREYVREYVLWLRFNDGTEGEADLASELHGEMFEPLSDPRLFSQARLNREFGTVVWPNGADLAPEFLHSLVRAAA